MRRIQLLKSAPGAGTRLVWVGTTATVAYWNERWARQRLATAVQDARQHPLLREIFLHGSSAGERVLEAGCGLGQWVAVLREHGRAAIGLDYDVATLRGTRGEALGQTLPLLGGDVRYLPFADASFDAYISLGVAEHFLGGPGGLLAEARRVLRPGGQLLISVPYFSPLRRLRARLRAYPTTDTASLTPDIFYQCAFRPAEFADELEHAGFHVETVVPFAATVGLYEDFPALARIRRRTTSARHMPRSIRPDTPPIQPQAKPTSRRAGRNLVMAAQSVPRRIVHSRLLRWATGHMVLFIARREPYGEDELTRAARHQPCHDGLRLLWE